ncbi:hypothetical protein [Flavobacterium gilvum]|uniref:Uncharacterized protein n=1 Tax=Flavobacterium gilvum TaxID=1492737 RepID=A0AAC9N5Y6_9FLAO|nr:hypothetical protein [Flavobacterium gilvum]AOW10481.1 hypothetical protein EM308_13765 [Flavobacterium gilvum]KFC61139.1 hypothetical protein FEM08_00750 [Flavobacterium gilvum]
MKIEISILHDLTYQVSSDKIKSIGNKNALRLLKGIYTNKPRFIDRYLSIYDNIELLKPIYNYFLENYEKTVPFTYKEAFEIEDENFRRMVFNAIDISDLIQNLGATRIKTDGIEVNRKCFDKQGNTLPNKNYHAVYETYQIDCSRLVIGSEFDNQENFAYAVKCWCTSTNKEHWIWIEDSYKDQPLEAIASTFRFHENVIPHIKELKRQGDIMLVELNQEIIPKGKIIPLTAEQYFRLLTIET